MESRKTAQKRFEELMQSENGRIGYIKADIGFASPSLYPVNQIV